ncbi:DUF5979 domain-containing protein [Arthrobacter sp. Z1-15]
MSRFQPLHEARSHTGRRRLRIAARGLLGVLLAMLMIAPLASPASARIDYAREVPANNPYGPNTDIVISRLGEGQSLTGALPPVGTTWPVASYPTSIPSGYQTNNPGFAGVIVTEDINGETTAPMYCIDIRTETRVGIGYENGTWDEATVPNIGYVNRILNSYYPTVPNQPAGLNNNQRAAAVQAAIWFFSDGYVVNPRNELYPAVQAIVNATIAAGPLTEPDAPDISITPATAAGPSDGVTGPYTVAAEGGATVTLSVPRGYGLFANAAGTQPLDNPVASGSQFWVRSTTGATEPATITARGVVTVPTGNVYLYDQTNPDVTAAQKLILASTRELSSTATATAEFFAVGSLTVTKTILGEAVGSQGAISINIDCGPGYQFTLAVDAGSTTGASQTFDGIPAGNTCTVTEPASGANDTVLVSTALPQPVIIEAGTPAQATVTDTYTFAPGTLVVQKLFTGEAAGNHGVVVLQVTCGSALNTTVTIPARQTEPFSTEFSGVPAGTVCTVTEPTTGSTTEVTATPTLPADVTITAAGSVTSTVSNDYTFNPGVIGVNKTIAGPAAGQQGDVVLSLTCTSAGTTVFTQTVTIPAGSTGTVHNEFPGVPAGATCSVVETATGATTAVGVVTESTGDVTIPPAGGAEITVTDTYSLNPGSLAVTKALAGPAVGQQGAVTLQVTCTSDGATVLNETVSLAAGSATGVSQTFTDIPANAECAVTEPATGETATVAVEVALPDTVVIPAGGSAAATVTDTYTLKPGILRVLKTIDGEAAGFQEAFTILISCGPDGSILQETWNVPPGVTGTGESQYLNIPAGTECTVTEPGAGTTPAISVVTVTPDPVTIPAAGVAEEQVTNTYSFNPGTLAVRKTFAGEAAGSQGDVQLLVTCTDDGDTVLSETVDIPAGETETFERAFEDLPAAAECTVTEPVTGATETVGVQTVLPDPVTIPAGDGAEAVVGNTYTFIAGSLVLNKVLAGEAAGAQDEIQLNVVCLSGDVEVLNETVTVAAGTTAPGSWTFDAVAAGAECVVTEPVTGSTTEVGVTTDLPGILTIVGGQEVAGTVTNTYGFNPGVITVTKAIAGEAAGQQGEVRLAVRCVIGEDLTLETEIRVPAGFTGSYSQEVPGVQAGSECIVTEPEDGSSESVTVQTTLPEPVAVAAGSTADLTVTNAYTAVPAPTPTPAPTPAPEKPERPEKPGKSGKLPKTGSDGTALAVSAGVGALGLGGLLLLAAKRRRGSGEDL